ncbi:MAG: adenylate/guanylate cyclase domain-containing protein [Proteobacteria bacterium]|nr:adenylate/guanylate cyclase domain-containing protein [Pseudomonadota bacterium]MBU1596045.1 adenylate/guanylate cyclase domain-containing protein [Pseudomonadota bacterium]
MRLSLRTAIISFAIGFGLVLTASLATYNYFRSTDAALETASELIAQAGNSVQLRIRLLAQPFNHYVDQVPLLPGAGTAPKGFNHPLLPIFLDALENNPQIYSLYFGYGDGGFFQAISLINRPQMTAKLKAPAGTRFALRRIDAESRRGGGETSRLERWSFFSREQKVLGTTPPQPATYDPRARPWFKSSMQAEGPQRTSLYVFSSTQELGLTVSSRVQAQSPVVFGMDLTLNSLSQFLAEAKVGPSGQLLLFDRDGLLIGHPDPARLYRKTQSLDGPATVERTTMETLGDPAALACYRAFVDSGRLPIPTRHLRVAGVDYMFQVQPMEELGSGRDFAAVISRAEDFTGPMARTRTRSLLFALGLMLVAVPLLAVCAGRFSKKLHALAEEADRIRTLDLDSSILMSSHIKEMQRLGSAVFSMRSALKSFSRYLPSALVKQFVDTGVDPMLGGERRELTLLFTDVEDFTPLSENLAPEELMLAMSEYFQVVGQAILECGGTIDKFIGDAVMAFWNAPFFSEDHVEKACVAALRLSKASEELNARRLGSGLPQLRTRIGVHTGAAVVGNIGSADRMDYTALGANVNLASRLEGLNKFYSTSILVSREVRERAKANFLFRSVDVVVPKGATAPMAVFELLGAMPQSPYPEIAAPRAKLGFCSRWERAITLYRTAQWDRALAEFTTLVGLMPQDHLTAMYQTRTKRLLENKQGKDWKAIQRFQEK